MPYEYRQFIKTNQQKLKEYDQLDLYFFKEKLPGVGIKARFSDNKGPKMSWTVNEIQLKMITNYADIVQNKTILQKWKKFSVQTYFEIFSRKFLQKQNPTLSEQKLKQLIEKQLKDIGNKIKIALKSDKEILEKKQKNPDLKKWLESDEDLKEVYAIQKSRDKSYTFQEGFVNVIPLFGINGNGNQAAFKTQAFEQKKQDNLKSLLKKFHIEPTENISYPKMLDKKYFGAL